MLEHFNINIWVLSSLYTSDRSRQGGERERERLCASKLANRQQIELTHLKNREISLYYGPPFPIVPVSTPTGGNRLNLTGRLTATQTIRETASQAAVYSFINLSIHQFIHPSELISNQSVSTGKTDFCSQVRENLSIKKERNCMKRNLA